MLIPIRCFSCGSMISCKYITYKKIVDKYRKDQTDTVILDFDKLSNYTGNHQDQEKTPEYKAMKDLNINRICCRRHMLCNVDLIDVI